MVEPVPFVVEIFNKSYVRQGWIGNPIAVECIPRHNAIGAFSVTVPSNFNRIDKLTEKGARIVCTYKGEQVFSGPIRGLTGNGPWMAGRVSFTAESDNRLLWRLLGYPVPGADLLGQNAVEDKRTGPAETVLKGFVSANLAGPSRWPAHQLITVAPDLGRGSTITAAVAMQPLADVLVPLIDQAGIGFIVRQKPGNGAGLELDVYQPAAYPRELSEEGRTVQSWEWTRDAPTVTRAIVGGPVDDVTGLRPWLRAVGAVETTYADVIENMVDASSVDNATERLSSGYAVVNESGEKNGVSVTLNDTTAFAYGGTGGVHVGDQITIKIGTQTITDVLREARIVWDRETGFKATPVAGQLSSPQSKLANFVNRLSRVMRALKIKT